MDEYRSMITPQTRIGVIGSGSWATAIVKLLQNTQAHFNWFVRNRDVIAYIKENGTNMHYLKSVSLQTEKISFYSDIHEAVAASDLLVIAIPSAFVKAALDGMSPEEFSGKFILSAVKGIIPEDLVTVTDLFHQTFGVPYRQLGVISGPCHAEEIARGCMSFLTIATQRREDAEQISGIFECRYLKTIFSDDIQGIELGGVLKNIYAIAAGISQGLGDNGDNFQAVLIANAFSEMERFLTAVYPKQRDLNQSVYLGDLLVTGYSQFSRNRTFGLMIGKGYTVLSAKLEMNMIAEGYYAASCIHEMNKQHGVDMPIAEAIYNILYEHVAPAIEIRLLIDKLS